MVLADLRRGVAAALPEETRQWIARQRRRWGRRPPVGWVRWGSLRRVTPISRAWGYDRGQPVDRYYIEAFLTRHAGDVRGRVLELANDSYTRRFGGDRVLQSDVLHLTADNPRATLVADLMRADHLPSEAFDCIICTQTLLLVYDLRAAIGHLHRMLKPGGVVLVTVPGISQISRVDMDRSGDCWRFTDWAARRLFEEVFAAEDVTVEVFGNVLTAIAFLHGLAAEELRPDEMVHRDPDYQVTIGVRAVKTAGGA